MQMNTTIKPKGRLLREARERLNWSQRDLAGLLSVSPGHIAQLEMGAKRPSEELWRKVTQLFGARPETAELFSGQEGQPDLSGHLPHSSGLEFEIESPFGEEWLSKIPFTVLLGPPGSGKTAFLLSRLKEMTREGTRRVLWVGLEAGMRDPGEVYNRILRALGHATDEPLATESTWHTHALAKAVAGRIEESSRQATVLCFDDWMPYQGPAHDFISYLPAYLKRTPIVATAAALGRDVTGSVVLSVPSLADDSWEKWCSNCLMPSPIRSALRAKIGGNPLAALYLRGAIFFRLSESPNEAPSGKLEQAASILWDRVLGQLPSSASTPWQEIVGVCRDFMGPRAWKAINLVANAPESVPMSFLDSEAESGMVSRLIEYRFLYSVPGVDRSRLATHAVLRAHASEPIGVLELALNSAAEPADVDALLALGLYEQAAVAMEDVLAAAQRRGASLNRLIDWMAVLPESIPEAHPYLQLGLARALALRAASGDLDNAAKLHEHLLSSTGVSEAMLWQVLLHAADLAIRQLGYKRAEEMVSRAQALARSAPGSFDELALRVLHARIAWEQGDFQAALAWTSEVKPSPTMDGARLLSWLARAQASLGNLAEAVRSAGEALELSRREGLTRAEGYNCALLGDYETLRGRFSRARTMAERARSIAKDIGQPNLEAQALGVSAELSAAELRMEEASESLFEAQDALTQRQADPWSVGYLLISKGRVARARPNWLELCSLAQQIERETTETVARYAPRHPLVPAMYVEAAACWAAAGYFHEAARVIGRISQASAEWRTRWELERLRLVTEVLTEPVLASRAKELIDDAHRAGCAYLAASCGYTVAAHAWRTGMPGIGEKYAAWTLEVANARGWKVLALMSAGLIPQGARKAAPVAGKVVVNRDGTRSVVAPPRGQLKARKDEGIPLPDPFEE